jgi:hypothetical protein
LVSFHARTSKETAHLTSTFARRRRFAALALPLLLFPRLLLFLSQTQPAGASILAKASHHRDQHYDDLTPLEKFLCTQLGLGITVVMGLCLLAVRLFVLPHKFKFADEFLDRYPRQRRLETFLDSLPTRPSQMQPRHHSRLPCVYRSRSSSLRCSRSVHSCPTTRRREPWDQG